jgi:plastocyanin
MIGTIERMLTDLERGKLPRRQFAVSLASLAAGSLAAAEQMGGMAKGPAAGTIATPAEAFDSQLSLIEGEMMSAVKAMPADKFAFAPSAANFVPGQTTEFATVRTFAQQATQVAEANYLFYGMISGLKPDVDPQTFQKLTKKDDVVAALAGSFAFAHKPSPRSRRPMCSR